MPNNKIIVKVGRKSALQFRSSYTYRAITIQEMRSLVEEIGDINIIIIENITEKEYKDACKFISDYISDTKNHVFFFTPNNDVVTTGLADELNLNIYLDSQELYRAIKINCNLEVSPDISITRTDVTGIDDFEYDEDDPFNNNFDQISSVMSEVSKSISSSDLVLKSRLSINDDEFIFRESNANNKESDTYENGSIEPQNINENENKAEYEPSDDFDDSKDTDDSYRSDNKIIELQNQLKEAVSDIEALKARLENENDNNNKLSNRILELNKIIDSIKSERDAIQEEFKKIEISDIIEDPETLSEIARLKEENTDLHSRLNDQSNLTRNEVKGLEDRINSLTESKLRLESENDSLETKNADLEIKIAELEQSLNNALNDSSKDIKIKELMQQIDEISHDIEDITQRLEAKQDEVNCKEAEISDLDTQVSAERSSKLMLSSLIREAKNRLDDYNNAKSQIEVLSNDNLELTNDLNQIKAELDDTRSELNKVQKETDSRVELARNFTKDELNAVKNENIRIKTQLEMTTHRLTAKEEQYNLLVRTAGIDENGVVAVLESNKTLEEINNQLRTSLSEYKSAYERASREKAEAKQAAEAMSEQKNKLAVQLKAMTTGFSGGFTPSNGIVPPINYSGRGAIITVTGSGSYGITTTAMSTAIRLLANSRVLYLDFDMVSAKADGWFNINPIIQGLPNMCQRQEMNTAIGLLLEKGAAYIVQYSNSIFKRAITSKNGFCDYASGLYASPDIIKFVSADLSSFITYCGNMYDYVIIDFGRIGTSDINNQVIKAFSDISTTSIVVSSYDRFDIRNTRLKLQSLNINMAKVNWLINMANSTKLDDKTKYHISPANYLIMPFADDFYGQKKDFNKDRMTKDKFNIFIDKMIINK